MDYDWSQGHIMRIPWFFIFFFFSGFCSLLYEVIWVRLGMAHFGVTTPVISIFLSLFMGGLGLGSWLSGRWMRNIENHRGNYPLRLYALTELLIGLSAWAVPVEMGWAKNYLENYGSDLAISSSQLADRGHGEGKGSTHQGAPGQ